MNIIEIGEWTYFVNIEWKRIIINDIATNYEVSNIGEVRNVTTKKILSQYTDKDGYKHATIILVDNTIPVYIDLLQMHLFQIQKINLK